MRTSRVVCAHCHRASEVLGWGFSLMAHDGWTIDRDEDVPPSWRCPSCAQKGEAQALLTQPTADSLGKGAQKRLRLLFVDDDELVLRATTRFFEGFDVCRAMNGEQALALLEGNPEFDAVVSDVSMPGMDGPELLRVVSERWPTLARRFLFVSGNVFRARPLVEMSARRAGIPMPTLLEKPLDFPALQSEMLALINRRVPESGAYAIGEELQPRSRSSS